MSRQRIRIASFVPALVTAIALSDSALSQVPPGHAVVATHFDGSWPGQRGMFIFPLDGGPSTQGTRITGLPAELGDTSGTPGQEGAWAVSLRSSDGAIIVTTASDPVAFGTHGDVRLFVLHLSGTVVTQYQAFLLGTANASVAMNHAQLPDGRILVHGGEGSSSPIASGPMAGHWSAILDPSSPNPITVLPNPSSFPASQPNSGGVAVDASGQFFYMLLNASYHGSPPGGWTLLRQDLTPPFADCVIASDANESAHGIRCDDDGSVYITSSSPTGMHTHVLTPDGCNMLTLSPVTANNGAQLAWGIDLDRSSGLLVSTTVGTSPMLGNLGLIDPATGARSVIGVPPSPPWSNIGNQGVAVHNVMRSYGPRSDGQNRYWFENFPNPGGPPLAGNTSFSLTTASAPGSASMSAMSVALGRGSMDLLGVEILVDTSSAVTSIVGGSTYRLPIPPDPALGGVQLTAQSLHLETGNTVAASRGLEFEVALPMPPTISSVSPAAPLAGQTVTVTGTNFLSGAELRVAGNLTPVVTQTMTEITFAMPAGVGCDSSVTVTHVGGTASHGINGTPSVVFQTLSGPAVGGGQFIVTGENLGQATVTIGGAPLMNISVQTYNAIVGVAPPGQVGPAAVVISSPTGCQTTGTYTYF